MPRSILVHVALWGLASGCTIDNRFGVPLPDYPASKAPALDDPSWTDTILQVTTPKVDILWMVDNSCSMYDNQTLLTENIPSFMEYFVGSGLDYHVGVTSSDTISSNYDGSDGTLVQVAGQKWIDADTPNAVSMFVAMATLGTTGRFPERGLGGTYLCLEEKRNTANAGFYRDEAALHTIIISDEPDYTEIISQPEYADWYSGLKDIDQRTFSSIIDPRRGTDYSKTTNEIGGITWDIGGENWDQVLEQLGIQAAGLSREYFLSRRPVLGTIEVRVVDATGVELRFDEAVVDPVTGTYEDADQNGVPDGDWTYDETRNSITFLSFVPSALSEVEITYQQRAAVVSGEDGG
jgi:hypothetical protein